MDGLLFRHSLGPGLGLLDQLPREVSLIGLQSPGQVELFRRLAPGRLLAIDLVRGAEATEGQLALLAVSVAAKGAGGRMMAKPCAFLLTNHLSEEIVQVGGGGAWWRGVPQNFTT